MNCVERFFQSDFSRSERPAIVFFDGIKALDNPRKNISFASLRENAAKAQERLKRKGFKSGDAVLLFEAPSPDMYAMILAMLASGMKLMLVEPWMPLANINRLIEELSPKGFMAQKIGKLWGLRSKRVRQIPHWFSSDELRSVTGSGEIQVEDMNPGDHAILTFTSGTSGNPKGVHRKHQYLIDQAVVLEKHLHYDENPGLDLTIFTNVTLLNLGMGKGSLLMPSKWPKKAIKDLDKLPEDYQVDTLAAGPAFLLKLMQNASVSSLNSFHLGGALADCWIYEEAMKRWPKATFTHVYGSSEAEPVAVSDLKTAVEKSREAGYFQTLHLGAAIEDITLDAESDSLWVSGPHVSPLYEGDEAANKKNKRLDENGAAWHNMGDRILLDTGALWYAGRDFQSLEEFKIEQRIYSVLHHSKCFLHRDGEKLLLLGELSQKDEAKIKKEFTNINKVVRAKIFRDNRHRARIDRNKSLKKAGYASV